MTHSLSLNIHTVHHLISHDVFFTSTDKSKLEGRSIPFGYIQGDRCSYIIFPEDYRDIDEAVIVSKSGFNHQYFICSSGITYSTSQGEFISWAKLEHLNAIDKRIAIVQSTAVFHDVIRPQAIGIEKEIALNLKNFNISVKCKYSEFESLESFCLRTRSASSSIIIFQGITVELHHATHLFYL